MKRRKHKITPLQGFTLVELVVVVTIIGVLFVSLVSIFNPLTQIEKAKNATRQQDINQIKNALDTYFNDNGCYPSTIPFGSQWSSGTTVYMEKVPQDPDCTAANNASCFIYQTDGLSCPQWNILYAKMNTPVSSGITGCAVATTPNCLPVGGIGQYNYCAVSGTLDCNYITKNPLPTPPVPSPTGSGGGGVNPTPTPTPGGGLDCNGQLSGCSNRVCNIESSSQCSQCSQSGTIHCYQGNACGGVQC